MAPQIMTLADSVVRRLRLNAGLLHGFQQTYIWPPFKHRSKYDLLFNITFCHYVKINLCVPLLYARRFNTIAFAIHTRTYFRTSVLYVICRNIISLSIITSLLQTQNNLIINYIVTRTKYSAYSVCKNFWNHLFRFDNNGNYYM